MEIFIKKFKQWSFLKQKIHYSRKLIPLITEGEVWWCSIGTNIGSEVDGKSYKHTRPILIFKKFSHDSFLGIPATSQKKTGSWYVSITFQNKEIIFILNQLRSYSAKRLTDRMGMLDEDDFRKIKIGFHSLFPNDVSNIIDPSVFQEGTREIPENLSIVEITIESDPSLAE